MKDQVTLQAGKLALSADTLQIWTVPLDPPRVNESWYDNLDKYEQERANKFRFPDHRRRFLVAHHAQREILARALALTPREIEFHHGLHGKPALQQKPDLRFHFNLSHSHELAVLALAIDREIGIDIEWKSRPITFDGVAERFFFPTEAAVVRQTPPELKSHVFYGFWTRKESYLKARGTGLSLGPELFAVVPDRHEPKAFRIHELGEQEYNRWRIWDVPELDGYAAALTVEGPGRLSIQMWNWQGDPNTSPSSPTIVSLD